MAGDGSSVETPDQLPEWWNWRLVFSLHVRGRMPRRHLVEVELRDMMERARLIRRSHEPGRWILAALHDHETWLIVVEPEPITRKLRVITAYPED